MAELVDALDLGSSIARCGGSSPSARTIPRTGIGDAEHGIASARIHLGTETRDIKTVETENEGLKRAFMLTIPAKDIEARVEQEVKRIAPQVRMPGFRPGKVPPNLIRKMHGDSAAAAMRSTARSRTASSSCCSEKNIRPALQPQVELDEDYEPGKDAEVRSASRRCPTFRRRRSTACSSSA